LANLEGQLARLKQQLSVRSEEPGGFAKKKLRHQATPNHGFPLKNGPVMDRKFEITLHLSSHQSAMGFQPCCQALEG